MEHLTPDNLAFLDIFSTWDAIDNPLQIASAVNFCVQIAEVAALRSPVKILPEELLFCCDVLNPGAQLIDFDLPDGVNFGRALDLMNLNLEWSAKNEPERTKAWEIEPEQFVARLMALEWNECFALAIAVRQFWRDIPMKNRKTLKECGDYHVWAKQWTES